VGILYPQKLALTSPTSDGRSVGIVPLRTEAKESNVDEATLKQFVWLSTASRVTRVSVAQRGGGLTYRVAAMGDEGHGGGGSETQYPMY
jgi:hypothetical protein